MSAIEQELKTLLLTVSDSYSDTMKTINLLNKNILHL